MARAALDWTARDLAKASNVGVNTINRLERGADALTSTVQRLRTALEAAGVEFIAENGGGPGVRLRKRGG